MVTFATAFVFSFRKVKALTTELGRQLTANYWGTCDPSGDQIEIQRAYDALPAGITCPSGVTCSRLGGHLAWVEASLMCTNEQADKAIEQHTFYGYDDAGRMIRDAPGHHRRRAERDGGVRAGQLDQARLVAAECERSFLAERRRSVDWLRELHTPDWEKTHQHPKAGPLRAGDLKPGQAKLLGRKDVERLRAATLE